LAVPTQTNRRLGKGLDALIPINVQDSQITDASPKIHEIRIDHISPNPFQPRKNFNPDTLKDLASSIKTHGLAQPIMVREINDGYELVVGERRLEACKINRFDTISAIIKPLSDKQSCEIALVENIDRENLNVIEVAQSLKRLMDDFDYTQETLSQLFTRSRSSIANILRLLKLPESIQQLVITEKLSEGHARTLIEFAQNPEQCDALADQIIEKKLSVRQSEALVKSLKKPDSLPPKQLQLFDNYIERLSQKLSTDVEINHKKNKLTLSVSYDRFKDYIDFLDLLCNLDDFSTTP
jgi:ParB family transcriptional regulator, chromosome partitioning protein